jgi:predicted NACHT family NTPase
VPFRVPILLPLRTYRKELATDPPPSLPSLIMQHHVSGLSALDKRVANLPENWAETRLRDGKALVMFDGFDEIPEAERPALSRWIQTQMRSFDLSVFILASRPRAYAEDFTDSLRTKIWVRPFTPKQQARFVTDWYRCQERLSRGGRSSPEVEQEAERNAHNLIAQIQDPQRTELADLAKNPLLLNLLATFHRSDPSLQLPRQRAELYQDICTLQLRKRPDARNIPLLLTAEERQTVLQAVALSLMESTLKLMPEADWLDRVGEVLTEQGHTGISAQTFLNQIIDVSELVVRQGREGCEFAHLSFQEFLAAKQIKDLKQEARLYPHLQSANQSGGGDEEAWWRQTILLYAAQTNPAPLIQEALRQGATDLAYACYQETQRTLDPAIVAELEALRPTLRTFRYARLEELLRTGNWREADQETYRLMITTVGKEEGQWFDPEDLLNFPCEDLKAIDGLWVKYSQGKFGFSVQKQIYVECGAKLDGQYPGEKIWDKFCDRVGWRTGGKYLHYTDLQANLSLSPTGEFPAVLAGARRSFVGRVGGVRFVASLLSHPDL